MKTSCNIIKDLLPLYIDNVLSEESKKMVEDHLRECNSCNEMYEKFGINIDNFEIKNSEEAFNKIHNYYDYIKSSFIILILSILISFLFEYLAGNTNFPPRIEMYPFNIPGYFQDQEYFIPRLILIGMFLYLIKIVIKKPGKKEKWTFIILLILLFTHGFFEFFNQSGINFGNGRIVEINEEGVKIRYENWEFQEFEIKCDEGMISLIKSVEDNTNVPYGYLGYNYEMYTVHKPFGDDIFKEIKQIDMVLKLDDSVDIEGKYKNEYILCLDYINNNRIELKLGVKVKNSDKNHLIFNFTTIDNKPFSLKVNKIDKSVKEYK